MEKIIIIGSPGSGKSVFARELSRKLNIPVFHLDTFYHRPDGTRMNREAWDKFQKGLIRKNKWIIDGNYQRTLDIRLEAADSIFFLDYPKWLCLWRSIKRVWQYRNKQRPDIVEGFKENINLEFLKKIVNYPRTATLEKIEKYRIGKKVLIMRNPKESENFLSRLR